MTQTPSHMPLSAGFLDRRLPNAPAAFLGFAKGRALVLDDNLCWVSPDPKGNSAYLGMYGGRAIFAQDLSHLDPLPGLPTDLWLMPRTLSAEDLALACQGQHLMRWHAKNAFCAVCGGPMAPQDHGRRRQCQDCGTPSFPRTDPAVIMLVQSPDLSQVLLAHTHVMPKGLHSLLAGYVEPGEALEDTVRRETFEEAGLLVEDIRYIASQPWALSGSLMCGFTCVARSTDIHIDTEELESAAWFSREDLDILKPDAAFIFPRRNTIARHILDLWRTS